MIGITEATFAESGRKMNLKSILNITERASTCNVIY
jgi:hypothetical protein